MRKFLDGSEHLFLDQNFGHLKVLSREHMNAVVMNPSQVCLSKRKDKDADGEVVGNIIHCKLHKGRFTKENKMVDVKLNYDSGLSKYYGLVDIAVKYDIFKKVSTRIELPDGEKVFEKTINENPEKYFTKEVMEKLEVAVAKEFKYGSDSSEAKAKE